MTLATATFYVLAKQHPNTVARVLPDNTQTSIAKCLWMEDLYSRVYKPETQRTECYGTLTILASQAFADTDQFLINGDLWTQHHLGGVDNGLRNLHLRRDVKVSTGGANSHLG